MGRAFEFRKARKMKRWSSMAKTFTRIGKDIVMAVKEGGADPSNNSKLRAIIQNAKAANMPKENVERAIRKASDKSTENYKEMIFEGYAPHGIAILIEATSDNNNRTVANIRSYFNKAKGSMGKSGSVDFLFERLCSFRLNKKNCNIGEIELDFIDYGVEEVFEEDNEIAVYGSFEDYGTIQKELENRNIEIISSSFDRIALSPKRVNQQQQSDIEDLIKKIEQDDDVQNVFHSMDIN
ncbi:MAG: YebC/PmpR family DNA-binding transcriptional regulator [Candidatus Marivariicella sp.]|nr:YebC/PmpR family DNA-binding transcriptional regulator [Flavobacteriales bacterium]